MELKQKMTIIAGDVNDRLDKLLANPGGPSDELMQVARYAAMDAGKRVRSFLTMESGGLFNAPKDLLLDAAAAIEMVHNFSLIHDDMPCIDNDILRRNKPSVWAKYGESTALLAGDLLMSHAFLTLSRNKNMPKEVLNLLADMTQQMIYGEWMDVVAETGRFNTEKEVLEIQSKKTGAIFRACTISGAIIGGADDKSIAALDDYTRNFGLAFQITDDILDAIGDTEKVGKTLRKDDAAGKATYISLLGLDSARQKAEDLVADAIIALDIFDNRADGLRDLMRYLITRES